MTISPEVSEARESVVDLISLECKIPFLLLLFPFAFICSLTNFLVQRYCLQILRIYLAFPY